MVVPETEAAMRLFLCGDLMTGRGIDQILPHPCDPALFEPWVRDARDYVRLAEGKSGPIPRNADFSYPWGEALGELDRRAPLLRLVNLETAVTAAGSPWPVKGIHYRMHPRNLELLRALKADGCALANNHVLDWGTEGLEQTLQSLEAAGIGIAGAGRSLDEAASPAVFPLGAGGRLLLFAAGAATSGVPSDWAAREERSGVFYLPDTGEAASRPLLEAIGRHRRPGDRVLLSVHWGGNWGYRIPAEHRALARRLIEEGGVDLIWGHSSHHPLGMEVHLGRLILYGCGDFLNDYEGIEGYEQYRSELCLMYLPALDPKSGALEELTLVPFRIRRFRLQHATPGEARWLAETLSRQGLPLGTRVDWLPRQGELRLRWEGQVAPSS